MMMWITRANGLVEFGVLAWMAVFQQGSTQQQQPSPSFLDNPVTLAAFLSLLAGALIHFIPRIAGALVKVIEAFAGIVEEWLRGMKARNDIIVELREQISVAFDRENAASAREGAAKDRNAELIKTAAESNRLTNEAQRLTNEANARIALLLDEKQKEVDARAAAEKSLQDERERLRALELQLAALNAWNASLVAKEKVEAEARAQAKRDVQDSATDNNAAVTPTLIDEPNK